MTALAIDPTSTYGAFVRAHGGRQPPLSSGVFYSLWLKDQRDEFFRQKFGTDRPELNHSCVIKDLCRQFYIADTAEEFREWLLAKYSMRTRRQSTRRCRQPTP